MFLESDETLHLRDPEFAFKFILAGYTDVKSIPEEQGNVWKYLKCMLFIKSVDNLECSLSIGA